MTIRRSRIDAIGDACDRLRIAVFNEGGLSVKSTLRPLYRDAEKLLMLFVMIELGVRFPMEELRNMSKRYHRVMANLPPPDIKLAYNSQADHQPKEGIRAQREKSLAEKGAEAHQIAKILRARQGKSLPDLRKLSIRASRQDSTTEGDGD